MRKHFTTGVAASLACLSAPAFAQDVTVSTGVDYSEGDFGSDIDTTILVVPFSVRTNFDGFSLTVTVPYLEIDGSTSVIGGGDGPIITDPDVTEANRSGIGDVNVRASLDLVDLGGAELSANGRIKIPTGSTSKGLSTGELDFAGGFELAATEGVVQPFGEIGYRVLGDPDGFDLENGFYGSAGAIVLFPGNLVGIASYDYVEASTSTIDDTHSLFGGLVIPASDRLSLTTYGTAGLSDSAADWGVGVLLSLKLSD
jgi:hypothetical protein